jgi:hypothetical protein
MIDYVGPIACVAICVASFLRCELDVELDIRLETLLLDRETCPIPSLRDLLAMPLPPRLVILSSLPLLTSDRVSQPISAPGLATSHNVAPSPSNKSLCVCHMSQQDSPFAVLGFVHRVTMPHVSQQAPTLRPDRPQAGGHSLIFAPRGRWSFVRATTTPSLWLHFSQHKTHRVGAFLNAGSTFSCARFRITCSFGFVKRLLMRSSSSLNLIL